jgi:CheY-like chemotaxis protein
MQFGASLLAQLAQCPTQFRSAVRSGNVAMCQSILVADDNDEVRRVIRLTLEQDGFDVCEAADGEEAVRALSDIPFDLVITDILMPQKDGLETIMHLRRATPSTKVIAMSGAGNELFLRDASGLGVAGILLKPFTAGDLRQLVLSVLKVSDSVA